MVGRAPVPLFAPAYSVEAYPPPAFAPRMAAPAPAWHGQPRQTPAPRPIAATSPPAPPPIIRLQSADEPRQPSREAVHLHLPTPEQLGVSTSPDYTDWSRVHERLDHLGAVCFHVDKLPTGFYRVSCLLPTSEPDRARRIEAEANNKTEAVRLALDKAEEIWRQAGSVSDRSSGR